MTVYGYARISTPQQDITRQVRNLLRHDPDIKIYEETYSGTKSDRPRFRALVKRVCPGDTIVFDEVSRMSRDAEEGYRTYRELYERGVELVFLKEPHINTSIYRQAETDTITIDRGSGDGPSDELVRDIANAINRYMVRVTRQQIRLAFERSQAEVDLLHKRTKEGMETARAQGKQIGRPKGAVVETTKGKRAKEQIRQYSRRYGGPLAGTDVIKLCGISRNSYFKYCREIDAETIRHNLPHILNS